MRRINYARAETFQAIGKFLIVSRLNLLYMKLKNSPISSLSHMFMLEKNKMVKSFLRFEEWPRELILDPTCFIARQYLEGTVEIAKSEKIDRLWIPQYLFEGKNLIDTLLTWKPERASDWFAWISTEQFTRLLRELRNTDKVSLFPTPKAKIPFREALSEIERENEIGAIMCAEILSFSFESENAIFLPELGLTDILRRSGNALLYFSKHMKEKKISFFASLFNEDKLMKTETLRWIIKGSLGLASLARLLPPEFGVAGIAFWILDP